MSYDFCLIFLLIGIMMMFSGFVFGLHYAFLIIGFCFITGSILLLLYNKIIVYLFLFSSSIFFLYDVFLLVTSLMKYKIDYLIDGIKITIFILLFYIVVSFIFIKYLKYRKTDDIKNYTLKLHPIVTVGFIDLVILVIWLIFVFWPMKLEKVDESIFKIDGYNYELTKEENGLYLLPEIFSDFQNCENMEMKGYASGNCNDELFNLVKEGCINPKCIYDLEYQDYSGNDFRISDSYILVGSSNKLFYISKNEMHNCLILYKDFVSFNRERVNKYIPKIEKIMNNYPMQGFIDEEIISLEKLQDSKLYGLKYNQSTINTVLAVALNYLDEGKSVKGLNLILFAIKYSDKILDSKFGIYGSLVGSKINENSLQTLNYALDNYEIDEAGLNKIEKVLKDMPDLETIKINYVKQEYHYSKIILDRVNEIGKQGIEGRGESKPYNVFIFDYDESHSIIKIYFKNWLEGNELDNFYQSVYSRNISSHEDLSKKEWLFKIKAKNYIGRFVIPTSLFIKFRGADERMQEVFELRKEILEKVKK